MGVDLFDALGGSVKLGGMDFASLPIEASLSMVTLAEYPTLTSGFGRLKVSFTDHAYNRRFDQFKVNSIIRR